MNPKLLKRDIGVSETTLKRTKATRLDIAVLAEQLQDLKAETCRDVEASRTSLQALDEKITAFDATLDSVGRNIGQCQNVIAAVKETLDAQTGRLTMVLRESEEHQQGRSAVVDERMKSMDERMTATDERLSGMDERMNEMTGSINDLSGRISEMHGSFNELGGRMNEMAESIRSIEEKNIRQSEAMQSRIQALEEHLPKLEAEMKALDGKADRIEQFQQKINARIVAVMRMSLAIFGVVVVTAIVFGFILLKK